jgi:hypothetical protein
MTADYAVLDIPLNSLSCITVVTEEVVKDTVVEVEEG